MPKCEGCNKQLLRRKRCYRCGRLLCKNCLFFFDFVCKSCIKTMPKYSE